MEIYSSSAHQHNRIILASEKPVKGLYELFLVRPVPKLFERPPGMRVRASMLFTALVDAGMTCQRIEVHSSVAFDTKALHIAKMLPLSTAMPIAKMMGLQLRSRSPTLFAFVAGSHLDRLADCLPVDRSEKLVIR